MTYHQILKKMRLDKGLNRAEWGKIAGITETVVFKIEAEQRPASVEKIAAWCKSCGVSLGGFFSMVEKI